MDEAQWKFRKMGKDELNQDPTQEEFFTTEYVGGIADALVRETIQNSLDAKTPQGSGSGDVVVVRFSFSCKKSINQKINSSLFFRGIIDHLNSNDNGLARSEFPDFSSELTYLTIEDFNTVGLDGDIEENDIPKTASPLGHNFFWFWRNVGRTGKTTYELGKWGLGKTVFPASSSINTFFGLTNRYDDDKTYLMGLSVLKTHHINSEPTVKRYPYGYFGDFSDSIFEYFVKPSSDPKVIANFRAAFDLKRLEHNDSGLSIVIPFPKKALNSRAVIQGVLRQYFYPIIKGRLIVEVVDADNNINEKIDHESISACLTKMELSRDFHKLFKLCLWSINVSDKDVVSLKAPPLENAARWQTEWFIDEKTQIRIDGLVDVFDESNPIAFDVPVRIKEIGFEPKICRFKVFLEKDELLTESDSNYVRDAITITGIRKAKNKFIRAIVVIEDKDLVKLLGLAENPAHTEWQKQSPHLEGKYEDGDKVISFVEMAIDKLCLMLLRPAEGIDREIMKDIFFIDIDEEDPGETSRSNNKEGEDSDEVDPLDIASVTPPFTIDREIGGFTLKKNPKCENFVGSIKIEAAYMVAKGSALKNYSEYDFNLTKEPIRLTTLGVFNLEYERNRISFDVVAPNNDFSIEVNGFDIHRDLYIKANHYDSEI